MPYIGTRVSVKLTADKEREINEKLGKAIELCPGKTERWLMTEFTDECHIWFGGDNSAPSAFVEVKVLGGEDRNAFAKMTGAICDILKDSLGISPDRVYVTYQGFANWGWNGSNF